jgi:acyl-CoA synthetase (AMP-forming)/AMP-acid ligase II
VWGTFYDIRRYGGLQILLRALTGGASMVLSDASQPTAAFLARLAAAGVTHQSGTPSHWRWALMNPELALIAPRYVRLSGEIADQAVLDSLRGFFPEAAIGHAYASTEAGVGFEVTDGLEGFPAALIEAGGAVDGAVEMKVEDGSLRIRSSRAAHGYAGGERTLIDADGFVDTGDMVERRGDRFYFTGRRGGVINIGGLKVHPEEIEAVLNRHPMVRMSLARARRNPITGALVAAEVVRSDAAIGQDEAAVKASILAACREALAPHKVPASLKFVESLAVTAGGKLDRQHA